MKPFAVFLIIAGTMFLSHRSHTDDFSQTVNSIIGDVSFVAKFGSNPGANSDEILRIKTHLEYVEDLLRQKDVSNLTDSLRQKRERLLDLLHAYLNAGVFPRNFDYPSTREPCFIDKEGRICAVGYLIEMTAGRQVAELINSRHQYDKILEMKDPVVDNWIATSGLTQQECAMIQPMYDDQHIYTAPIDAVVLNFLGGANIGLNIANSIHLAKRTTKKGVPIAGIITGGLELATGSLTLSPEASPEEKGLSSANIALGAATVILSSINLAFPKEQKNGTAWNVSSIPSPGKGMDVALSFSLRF